MYDKAEIITEVEEDEQYYFIATGGSGFGLEKKHGVMPNVGDLVEIALVQGSTVRGVKINGKEVFYKTDEQLEEERLQWLKEHREKQLREFEENKAQMDADYDELPEFFKKRIDRFRKNNPEFRVKYEQYEVFCCKEAVKIANACKNPEEVQKFAAAEWDNQRAVVPDLSDGHSGNTFGGACQLAYWFLKEPEAVEKMHGSLSVLVGSKEYGDIPQTESNS